MQLTLLSLRQKRQDPFEALAQAYLDKITRWRMQHLSLLHKGVSDQTTTSAVLASHIPAQGILVVLDETGDDLTSETIAETLRQWENQAHKNVTFLIGGPDGLTPSLKMRAQKTWCFGRQTWPHKMVALMLAEQLYRAQQILENHPYHRA